MPGATVARGTMSPVTYQYGLSCFSHRDTEELFKRATEIDEAVHTHANEWSAIRSKRVRNGTPKGIEVCDDSKR